MKFFISENGGRGDGKSFIHDGGLGRWGGGGGVADKKCGVVFPQRLEVLAILKEGAKSFHPHKGNVKICTLSFFPCLFSAFCSPPPPPPPPHNE